jgi:hypothetical protein
VTSWELLLKPNSFSLRKAVLAKKTEEQKKTPLKDLPVILKAKFITSPFWIMRRCNTTAENFKR